VLFGKVFAVAIGEKTHQPISRKFYGTVLGIVVFSGLIIWAIYPALAQPENSVVFLHTAFPPAPVVEEQYVQATIPEFIPEDPEHRLVSMLAMDDFQIAGGTNPQNTERWQVVRMRVTGYCSCPKCCGKSSDGITASQHRIRRGDTFVAADKSHPFGTEMVIPGYNNAQPVKVLDRGRAIKGNRLDLYFDSHQQAKKWGVKHLNVLVKIDE
jgi:3D (Asp-Asp-Asp) domain-containing protein